MKGGTFKKAMTQPFTAPKQAMMARVISRDTNQGMSGIQSNTRAL